MKFLPTLLIFTIVTATFVSAKRKFRQGTPTDIELVELEQDGNCTNAVYVTGKGSIRFPHSNSGEGPSTHCRYSFNITDTANKTYLEVIFLAVQTAILAADDHLAIFDGINVRQYSGHLDPFVIMVQRSEKTYISLNTSNNDMVRKLTILYSAESCMLNYQSGPPVKITSPIYTKKDHQTFNCTWIVTGDSAHRIYLQFSQFHITTGNVTVQSGSMAKMTYSGIELPDDYMTIQPNIRITMLISTEKENESFSAIYTFADEVCSTIKELSGPNTILFPKDASRLSATCINVLTVADERIKIAGKIESVSEIGSYAVTVVNDGTSHSQILAMHSTDDEFASYFVTSGQKVVIFYRPYGIGASTNVTMTIQSAGGYYKAGIVEITKPVNKENSVLYTLAANKGNLVRLSPIGNGPLPENCTIKVYDKDERKLLASFSNDKLYETTSNSDRMLLDVQNFHSDTIKFNFTEISNECSGFGSTNRENFHIVNQKSYVGPCVYTIRLSEYEESDSISLHINGANLEKDDAITILEDGKLIFRWNETDFTQENKLVYGNAASTLVVHFEPGKSRTQTTGNAMFLFYTLKQDCRGVITVDKNTTIKSPKYPNLYPLNAHCNWTLVAPANKTLLLSFKKIQLSSNESLQVREEIAGNETILYSFFTNDSNPDDIITSGNKTSVIFNAPPENDSHSEPDYGFVLEAYVLDCGGHIKNGTGMNSTPNYPAPINSSMFCAWILEVPESQIIKYTFHLESSPKITNGSLTFHDGGSIHSPVLSLNETLTGRNKLLVTYQYIKNETDVGAAFQIAFTDAECSAKCLNGLCLRNEWRCNRIDECGDNSDEIDCPFNPAAIYNGVAVPAVVGTIIVVLIIGIAIGIVAPLVYHRIKNPRHYQEFRPNIVDDE